MKDVFYTSLFIKKKFSLLKLKVKLHKTLNTYPMKFCNNLLPFLICLTFFFTSCKKHVVKPVDQLSLLPAATQTGARTFGCLLNGKSFIPKDQNLLEGPDLQCNYIYTQGGYHLTVAAGSKNSSGNLNGIIVGTDSLVIAQGGLYNLKSFSAGNADASYTIYPQVGIIQYVTNDSISGNLSITKLDTVKQIVSGTFYFTAINSAHDTVKNYRWQI